MSRGARRVPISFRVAALAYALLCMLAAAAAAAEGGDAVPIAVVPSSGGADPRLEQILLESVSLELERSGVTTRSAEADAAQLVTENGSVRVDPLRSLAGGAACILVVRYALQTSTIRLHLSCHSGTDGTETATVSLEGPMGLNLDSLVAEGIRSLQDQVTLPRTTPGATQRLAAESSAGPAATALGGAEPPAAEASALSARPVDVEVSPLPAVSAQLQRPPAVARLLVAVGVAPFFTTGRASEYFTSGVAESFWVGYRLPILADHIEVGMRLGAYGFDAQGELASSRSTLVPLGLEAALRMEDRSLFTASARLSGGPAIFTMNPNGVATLSKVLFHLHVGVGLSLMLLDRVGVGVEAGYTLFFEKYFPIMGFVPSVHVLMRR